MDAAWRVATPVLDLRESLPPRDFPNYAAGILLESLAYDFVPSSTWRSRRIVASVRRGS